MITCLQRSLWIALLLAFGAFTALGGLLAESGVLLALGVIILVLAAIAVFIKR